MISPLLVVCRKTPAQVASDLREAAKRIIKRGFAKQYRHAGQCAVKNGFAERVGAVCLLGAFEATKTRFAEEHCPQALNVLAKFLPKSLGETSVGGVITRWNNAPERTKKDVLQVLLTTAEKVEAGILSVL